MSALFKFVGFISHIHTCKSEPGIGSKDWGAMHCSCPWWIRSNQHPIRGIYYYWIIVVNWSTINRHRRAQGEAVKGVWGRINSEVSWERETEKIRDWHQIERRVIGAAGCQMDWSWRSLCWTRRRTVQPEGRPSASSDSLLNSCSWIHTDFIDIIYRLDYCWGQLTWQGPIDKTQNQNDNRVIYVGQFALNKILYLLIMLPWKQPKL